jgi:hypothetical protein
MTDQETTQFSGVTGRVLWGTMSIRSLVTGVLLGLAIMFSNWVLFEAHAPAFTTPLNQVIFAFVVARFVLNGQFGEWQGSIISASGGSWVDVIQVAVRYLALTFLWLLPLILIGLRPEAGPAMMSQKMIVLMLLYLVASILTPPVMLIVAVSADSFAEMFSSQHWKDLFSGRMTDLFAIYAVYTGGMAMAVLLSAPSVIIAFAMNWKLGAFVGALGFCFLLGMSLDLLGRLCGFFALGEFPTSAPASAELPLTPTSLQPHPRISAQPVINAPTPAQAAPTGAAPIAAEPLPQLVVEAPVAPPVSQPKMPPLMNAKQYIDQIMARATQDLASAIAALTDLRGSYAPNAQVVGSLAICRHRNGDIDEAVQLASEALPLAFERGHSHLAADIFKEFKPQLARLNLNREQILMVATAAAAKGDLSVAGEAYSMILVKDAGEMRAVKGLLKVAERILREKDAPAVAIKVYHFLNQRCAGTPMAEHISQGLEEAERRLIKPTPA